MTTNIQLNDDGSLKHLLTIDGLSKELITEILTRADAFLLEQETPQGNVKEIRKVNTLRGRTIANVFFEDSTRTRTTFEVAAKRLSADILSLDIKTSSANKGESLLDTMRNLEATTADMFVIRHGNSGAAHFFAEHAAPGVSIVNGGDGRHSHPTQALLDMFTIRRKKGAFENLKVVIVGDVRYSRVARSQILALKTLGVEELRVVGPRTLLPPGLEDLGVTVYHDMDEAVRGVDVVIMLRLQHERMQGGLLPSLNEYLSLYGLDQRRLSLADPKAIVMHPGPINRGVEITSDVADGPQSVILDQVTYGIAVRMAVMTMAMQPRLMELN